MKVSIPLRYGTTVTQIVKINNSGTCQFLLGTVQHEIITESELKYFIMCQFLLGTVQPLM